MKDEWGTMAAYHSFALHPSSFLLHPFAMTDPLLEYRERLLNRLEAVVSEIADTVAAVPESRWHQPLRAGARPPHAIIAHLRDVERNAYAPRLRRLLDEDMPEFESFDPEKWEADRYNPDEPLTALLAEYAGLRETEMSLLRPLTSRGWARCGRHITFGVRAVQWWVERALRHAEEHLRELREQS